MEFNLKEKQLLQEIVKKYKQGLISGILQGDNITLTPTGCRNKIISSTGGGGTSYVPPYLKTGGASWSGTGLVYDVTTLEYYFNGDKLTAATQVTLDASDPDDNRLDAIVVDESGVVSVIKGDASASPISPSVDESHILVQYILVEAGSTQPTIAKEDIYLENAEWTTSTYTTGAATGSIDFDNAVSPKQGVKCISANADARLGARFVRATSFDPYQYTMLSMWVRFTGSNVATNKSLNVRFENGAGALVANTINLFSFGLQRNLLNVWQLVVIPITSFGALPTSVKGLKIIMTGGTVGQARQWDIDLISLTDNSVPSINEQAFNILKDGALVGQSSTLNFKGASVNVTNDNINNKIDVEVTGGGGGGDYIPLTGTEVGKPVTGNIQLNESVNIYHDNGTYGSKIIFEDGGLSFEGFNGNNENYNFSFFQNGEFIINSNVPTSRGLVGSQDYGANYDDNTYVQKKYVDELVTANSVTPLSSLSPATSANVIDNGNKTQEWQWNSLTSGIGLELSSNSTAATSNSQTLFSVNQSGANATTTQTTYGAIFSNKKTGTSSTNIGGRFVASGANNNYAIEAESQARIISSSTGSRYLSFWSGTTENARIGNLNAFGAFANDNLDITNNCGMGIVFRTGSSGNGTERGRFRAGGALCVNTTGSDGSGSMVIAKGSNIYAIYVEDAGSILLNGGVFKTNINTSFGTDGSNNMFFQVAGGDKQIIANANGVSIGANTTPAASAILDVVSTTKGFLPPRMTTTQKNAIPTPAEGLEVYDLTLHQKSYYNGTIWVNI